MGRAVRRRSVSFGARFEFADVAACWSKLAPVVRCSRGGAASEGMYQIKSTYILKVQSTLSQYILQGGSELRVVGYIPDG